MHRAGRAGAVPGGGGNPGVRTPNSLWAVWLTVLMIGTGCAQPAQFRVRAGDEFLIRRTTKTMGEGSSSFDRDTLTERIISVRDTGLELEYDLPLKADDKDREKQWQYPVRVLKSYSGSTEILNGPELESRVGRWLEKANWPRAVCGHWVFTWNAFRIDCDLASVKTTIEAFDLWPADLREGGLFRDAVAREAVPLVLKRAHAGVASFVATMAVDPAVVRRRRAESDVASAEIMKTELTLEAALRAHADEKVSGTITTVLETDSRGRLRKQTKETKLDIAGLGQRPETTTTTEEVERLPMGAVR